MSTVIKFAKNSNEVRFAYKDGRAIATIEKIPGEGYRVNKLYGMEMVVLKSYSEAAKEAKESPNFFQETTKAS